MFYDVHCHLDMLSEKELKEALQKAEQNNISQIISCSTSFDSNARNLALAKMFPEIKAAIGLYPLEAMELNDEELKKAFSFFKSKIKEETSIAVGEVGLDFKFAKKAEQQKKQIEIFRKFIELSNETGKPLIIHSRFAQKQVLETLEAEKAEKAVLHSFVDSERLMKRAAGNGYFVSVGLAILENNQIQKDITRFPLENLLFETDSPFRFNNEQAFPHKLLDIVSKVAELKKIPIEEIGRAQEISFKKLFL
ncbi:MAG: TatD family hydrolase [Candidatus Diapherotrites archaeon]|nr:TatD family hydrolase [Candidatus Diapherotrites archaeon]